jgi:hypothetical protein
MTSRYSRARPQLVHTNRGRPDVFTTAGLKECRRSIVDSHMRPDNLKGSIQIITTLVPIADLWYAAVVSARISH